MEDPLHPLWHGFPLISAYSLPSRRGGRSHCFTEHRRVTLQGLELFWSSDTELSSMSDASLQRRSGGPGSLLYAQHKATRQLELGRTYRHLPTIMA